MNAKQGAPPSLGPKAPGGARRAEPKASARRGRPASLKVRHGAASGAAELRRRAEALVELKGSKDAPEQMAQPSRSRDEVLHELRVHQIELEMQNEELRRAQAELDAGRARYFDLYDQAPVGYCTIGARGRILEANLTAAMLLRAPRSLLVHMLFSQFIRKEDENIYFLHRKAFRERGEPFECDLRMVRKDGSEFWAHLAASPSLAPSAGQAQDAAEQECRVVLSDITERKQAIEKQQAILEGLIRDRTAALSKMVKDLEQNISERKRVERDLQAANQRKDEFLATLAHELRNPLAPIRTGAYILSSRHNQDPVTKPILDIIARQSTHMARIVDDLLDYSRIERGKVELRKESVDLGQVATQAMEACKPQLEADGHHLTLALPCELPALQADPVRLEQMLCNLVNNACKFTPMGGEINVSAALEGPEVVVRVRDNGMGMTPDAVAHAFDLFYQADLGMDRPRSGLGIGLTLVRQLVELHGGSAAAHSEGPGMGSEFLIRFPVLDSGQKGIPSVPVADDGPKDRPRHVLIIDDDDSVRTTSGMLLKEQNYQVTLAASGEKGIQLAKALRPVIALIDIGMPGLDGLEVAARIRAELGNAIHLVALTGYSRDIDIAKALAAGFDQYVVKTGDPRDLLSLLSRIP